MGKFAARSMTFAIGSANDVIAQVASFGEAGSSRDLIDASAYGDDWKDYVLGQQDGDEVPVQLEYDPDETEHEAFITAYDAATPEDFYMQHEESGFAVTFPALVTALSRGGARDGLLVLNATLKILNPGVTDVSSS